MHFQFIFYFFRMKKSNNLCSISSTRASKTSCSQVHFNFLNMSFNYAHLYPLEVFDRKLIQQFLKFLCNLWQWYKTISILVFVWVIFWYSTLTQGWSLDEIFFSRCQFPILSTCHQMSRRVWFSFIEILGKQHIFVD